MSTTPVTLDFNKAQPIESNNTQQGGGVTLDFQKAQPVTPAAPAAPASSPSSPSSPQEPSTMGGVSEDSITEHPVDSVLEHLSNMGTNLLRGGESSAQGVADLIHRIPVVGDKIIPKEGLEAWNQTSQQRPGAGNAADKIVGYGGETLMEFLMGDEALKSLSLADRLAKSASIAKALQNSPRLMEALKMGASVSKAQTQLGPEEVALLRKFPVLARFVGLGMDALRAGAVQGAETAVKTQGSVAHRAAEGAKSGAEMTAGTAIMGAPFAAAGGVLAKGATAAKTVQEMGRVAENAPTQEAITQMAQDVASKAQDAMHANYEKGVQDLEGWLGDQTVPYEDSPLHKAAQELAEEGESAKKPLDEAFAQTRPGSSKANKMVDMLVNPNAAEEEEAAKPKVESFLDKEFGGTPEEPKEEQPPIELNFRELLERRQQLGQRLRKLGWVTAEDRADREIYGRLIDGIDDTLKKMGEESGNPEVSQRLEQMNTQYRQAKALLKNNDVQALLRGNINDIGGRLLRGETSKDDIDAVRKFLKLTDTAAEQPAGTGMRHLTDSIFQRWVADATTEGKFDPEKLVKKWSSVKPDVRDALFQENRVKLQDVVQNVGDAASVKKLIKYVVLPATGGVLYGPLGALIGFVAHGGNWTGAGQVLDWVANHPLTWKSLEVGGRVANSAAAKGAARVGGFAAGKMTDVIRKGAYDSAANALGGSQ